MAKKASQRTTNDLPREQSDLIRLFFDRRPLYERLCSEVAYSVEHALKSAHIEVAAVTARAKTLDSLLEKARRKAYDSPLNQITDLAGVRVVHLYESDFRQIHKIIKEHFVIDEMVDKHAAQGADRFGYSATHFIVRLGEGFSGARYNDLKSLTCEIQVRTALQDAWSILSHHLLYKRESDIPPQLRRRINSLAGLLETADDQFERIRKDRDEYVSELERKVADKDEFLKQDVNADSVTVFLKKKFPHHKLGVENHANIVLMDLDHDRYPTIGDLDSAIRRTEKARSKYFEVLGKAAPQTAFGILAVSLGFDDPKYRHTGWDDDNLRAFDQFEDLVQKT